MFRSMEFYVLGPVTVTSGSETLKIWGLKQRLVDVLASVKSGCLACVWKDLCGQQNPATKFLASLNQESAVPNGLRAVPIPVNST